MRATTLGLERDVELKEDFSSQSQKDANGPSFARSVKEEMKGMLTFGEEVDA